MHFMILRFIRGGLVHSNRLIRDIVAKLRIDSYSHLPPAPSSVALLFEKILQYKLQEQILLHLILIEIVDTGRLSHAKCTY